MCQVFISYFRENDEPQALEVIERVERELPGVKCWRDGTNLRGGTEWRKSIDAAIRASSVLILIMTPGSLEREWVTYEWIFALGAGKTVIPAVFRKPDKYHERLKDLHWRFFTEDRKPEWEELLNDLRSELGNPDRSIGAPFNASPFIKQVVDDLEGSDQNAWREAIKGLFESEDPDALRILKQVAEKFHTPKIKYLAAFAHVKKTTYNDIVWGTVRDAAVSLDKDMRLEAWEILGNMGGPTAIEILEQALSSEKDHPNRITLIGKLGRAGRKGEDSATSILVEHWNNTRDIQEQHAVIDALAVIRTASAVEHLTQFYRGSVQGTKKRIVRAFSIVKTPEAMSAVVHLLQTERDASIQYEMINCLRENPSENVINDLESILGQPRQVLSGKLFHDAKRAVQEMRQRLATN